MIVDCVVHTWRYPEHIIKDVWMKNEPPRRRDWPEEKWKAALDNPIENYLAEMEGVVDKAILQGANMPKSIGEVVPDEYIAEIVSRYPDKFVGTTCIDPTEEGAAEKVERAVKELGFIGLGELGPTYQWFYANDERCFPVWEKAQELGIPVFIHAGYSRPRASRLIFGRMEYLDEVAVNFPDLKIVICHMGYYQYEDYINLVQKHDNVFADISWLVGIAGLDKRAVSRYLPVVDYGYYYHWLHPLLYYFSQTFGMTDKLLFGSDWPASSPRRVVELLNSVNELLRERHLPEIPEQSIHNIIYENWKKVFDFQVE